MQVGRALALAVFVLSVAPGMLEAKIHRSAHARAEFKRLNPCPSTGKRRGKCPGYVIDHRQALCIGGSDSPDNMQWQTIAEAKAKDRWECRR